MNNIEDLKVGNNLNNTNLEYINIYGLFDRLNATITFEKEVNIFIGENGLGKTTILNCIYYILNKNLVRLSAINFSTIEIKFKTEDIIHKINMADILSYLELSSRYGRRYNTSLIEHLINEIRTNSVVVYDEESLEYITRKFAYEAGLPINIARKEILNYIRHDSKKGLSTNTKGDKSKVEKLLSSINNNIVEKILYLPTYRRIEDDFSKLNIDGEQFKNTDVLIKFGMSDVQNLIDSTLEKIRKEAMDGFTKMTGLLLKEYSNDNRTMIKQYNYGIDGDALKIALNRIGDKIEATDKQRIIEIHNSNQIYERKYNHLYNLLLKLIDNYQLQKKFDDKIKNFVNTCNKYLNEKEFIYNESDLTLEIKILYCNEKNSTIELKNLSSGEKQIISLFSKLYLDDERKSIIIIDEPELSLSIKWQSMLLPDIMRTNNCSLLITVTHSPFIFDNEFDNDAKEIRYLIKSI